jgi:hypothetical protein
MKANTLTPELLHKMDAVTLDGYAALHRAVREFSEHPLEQDHRAIKSRQLCTRARSTSLAGR